MGARVEGGKWAVSERGRVGEAGKVSAVFQRIQSTLTDTPLGQDNPRLRSRGAPSQGGLRG